MWTHKSKGRKPSFPAPEPVKQRVTLLLIRERAEDGVGGALDAGASGLLVACALGLEG